MNITRETLTVSSKRRCEMIDITAGVSKIVRQNAAESGFVIVFCPHTTAAITINENADPNVTRDMLLTLEELIPKNNPAYRHIEGNSDAHVKSSLTGTSEHILINNGKLLLGTWQSIYFCEFDGPRTRKVIVQLHAQ